MSSRHGYPKIYNMSHIIALIADRYNTTARFEKAAQYLRENGQLTGTPKDIDDLYKEVRTDIKAECEDEIKDQLFQWAWPHIKRMSTRGLAEWYKQQLVKGQFDDGQDVQEE